MEYEKAFEIYQECMNMDLNDMLDLISQTASEVERDFYVELYNYVLHTRQKECIANGVY